MDWKPHQRKEPTIQRPRQSNDKWAWRTAHTKKGKVGGPSGVVGRPAHGPHRLQAPRGCPLLVSYVGSRRNMPVSRLRRGWLPPIYMRGGAPFSTMEEMEDLHHHYKLH